MNIAIVGFGGMGRAHLEYMIPRSKFKLKGIYDSNNDVIKEAKENGIFCYQDLEEIALDKTVDLVLVATPNDSHMPITLRMLAAGKAVLCEKPVGLNSVELEQMITSSIENKAVFAVNQNRRYDNDFLTAKKIIEDNILGEVFHIESKVYGSRGIPGDWRGEKKHGGGMLFDWGIHLIDQLSLLSLDIVSLYAEFTNITNDEVDDGFRVHFRFENGATALVEVGTSYFIEQPRWFIAGTNGTALVGGFNEQWKEEAKLTMIKSWEKKEVKPVKAANGFTKTMAPRDEKTEIEVKKIDLEPGDPIEIYDSIYESICCQNNETVISHQSLRKTFKLIEDIFDSAENNKVIKYEVK